jgi:hypothetical protein
LSAVEKKIVDDGVSVSLCDVACDEIVKFFHSNVSSADLHTFVSHIRYKDRQDFLDTCTTFAFWVEIISVRYDFFEIISAFIDC